MENRRNKYRECFSTSIGMEVLNDMSIECGFYENMDTPEDMALFNYFRSVLEVIGIFDAEHINKGAIINKLMELPLIPEILEIKKDESWKQGHVLPKGKK